MSCFVVTEWNCKLYEDYDANVVGVFHGLGEAEKFVKEQPKLIDDKFLSRRERERNEQERWARFYVEEFDGPRCLMVYRAKREDGALYRDRNYVPPKDLGLETAAKE
ncbi:MAG: hypothetical protein EPN91_08385 [Salinibacterium sp.]|nr:MAG: hypothetical protein EPN91_08385 [Salinibacterium sp.]